MIIELTPDEAQELDTTLDGVELNLKIDWNERAQSWFLGVYDVADVPILAGIKVQVGESLLNHNRGNLPPGVLLLVRLDGSLASPGRNDLNQYFLEYLTLDEYALRLGDLLDES